MSIRKKVLVTGATGWLGSRLLQALITSEEPLDLYGSFHTRTWPFEDEGRVMRVCLDLSSRDSTREAIGTIKPDVIFHIGAITSPADCEKNSDLAFVVNGSQFLIDAIVEYCPCCLFIFTSTDLVYFGIDELAPYTASDELETIDEPVNVYGKSKKQGEVNLLASSIANKYCLRLSNMIGEGEGKFLAFLLGACQNRSITGLRHDEVRSFVSINDVVLLLLRILALQTPAPRRVFNVGGPEGLSRLQLARLVASSLGVTLCLHETQAEAAEHAAAIEGDGDGEARCWCVYQTSNAESIAQSGIPNPKNVCMSSSMTSEVFDFEFTSMSSLLLKGGERSQPK